MPSPTFILDRKWDWAWLCMLLTCKNVALLAQTLSSLFVTILPFTLRHDDKTRPYLPALCRGSRACTTLTSRLSSRQGAWLRHRLPGCWSLVLLQPNLRYFSGCSWNYSILLPGNHPKCTGSKDVKCRKCL